METTNSDLVLRLVGGNHNGQMITVKTRKCLLGHRLDQSSGTKTNPEFAIFRGPGGAAVRSYGAETLINGQKQVCSWIQQGDRIETPNLTVEVHQLGSWPQDGAPLESQSEEDSPVQDFTESDSKSKDTEMIKSDKDEFDMSDKLDAMKREMERQQSSAELDSTQLIDDTLKQIQDNVDLDQTPSITEPPAEPTLVQDPATEQSEPTNTFDDRFAALESERVHTEPDEAVIEPVASFEPEPEPESAPVEAKQENESVAEVLERMRAEGQLEFEDQLESQQDIEPVEQPLAIETPPEPVVETPAAEAPTGEEDVEDYMNQLFTRLRGGDAVEASMASIQTSKQKASPTKPTQTKPVVAERKVPVELLTASEFKPVAVAPERGTNLDAMRELANANAREAVALSRKKRQKASLVAQLAIIGAGAVAAVALFFLSNHVGDAYFIGGVGSAIASLGAGARYLLANFTNKKN